MTERRKGPGGHVKRTSFLRDEQKMATSCPPHVIDTPVELTYELLTGHHLLSSLHRTPFLVLRREHIFPESLTPPFSFPYIGIPPRDLELSAPVIHYRFH